MSQFSDPVHKVATVQAQQHAQGQKVLYLWTLFDHPDDNPTQYVARAFVTSGEGVLPTGETITSPDAEIIRAMFRQHGLTCIARSPEDHPNVMESWV